MSSVAERIESFDESDEEESTLTCLVTKIVTAMSHVQRAAALEEVASRIERHPDRSPVVYCQVSDGAGGNATLDIDLAAVFATYGPQHVQELAGSFAAWLRDHARHEVRQSLVLVRDLTLAELSDDDEEDASAEAEAAELPAVDEVDD